MLLEDVISAQEDFDEVLSSASGTPLEAFQVLRSYDLTRAPEEELRIFIEIFSSSLQKLAERTGPSSTVQTYWKQSETLLVYLRDDVLRRHPSLAAQAQSSWVAAIVHVVTNSARSSCQVHLNRLSAVQPWAYECLHAVMEHMKERKSSEGGERETSVAQEGILRALVYLCVMLPIEAGDDEVGENRANSTARSVSSHITEIFNACAVPCTATCAADYCLSLQSVFQETLDCLQTSVVRAAINAMSEQEQKACYQRLWDLVSSPRYHYPVSQDAWWGVFASVCQQLARQVTLTGSLDLNVAAVAAVLFNKTSAIMLVQCLLANPSNVSKGVNGMKRALESAKELLGHCPSAFISACCELLAEGVNAPMATRFEALQLIKGVAARAPQPLSSLGGGGGSGGEEIPCVMWQAQDIQHVLFCIHRDPSVKVRRKAMEVLHQIASKLQAPQEELPRLIAATCMRCRDQDVQIRKIAYSTLESFSKNVFDTVLSVLSVHNWHSIFEHGLSAAAPTGESLGKHERDIAECAPRLLKRYLKHNGQHGGSESLLLRLQQLIQGVEPDAVNNYLEALGDIITFADWQEMIQ